MSALIFGVPVTPPPATVNKWGALTVEWLGVDGTVWNLNNWRSGIQLVQGGVTGLHFPSISVQASTYAGQHGQRRRGVTVEPREISLPLLIWAGDSSSWLDRDRAFWASFGLMQPGTLLIGTPDGKSRRIDCNLNPDGGHSFDVEPVANGWGLYTLELIADEPFWHGLPLQYGWGNAAPVDFFDPALSPPFHISNAATLVDTVIDNPGDIEGWPVWTVLAGPDAVTATITVDGGTLQTPAIPAGQLLSINTDPFVQTALIGSTSVYAQMGWDPRPVPPGDSVPVTLDLDRAGQVGAMITPRHYRAW